MYEVKGLNQKFTNEELVAWHLLGQCLMVGVMYLMAKVIGISIGLGQAGLIILATAGIELLFGALYCETRGIVRLLTWLASRIVSIWMVKAILGVVLVKAALLWGLCYLSGLAILGLTILALAILVVRQTESNVDNNYLFDLKPRSNFNSWN